MNSILPHQSLQIFEDFQKNADIQRQLIETLAAAIYTCDADGCITFYNKAAVELWGREPEIGKDLWCGSWKIFRPENGEPMALDECPMAKALKEGKSIRGEEIIVERPDGIRRNILPHPDPIFDDNGHVVAAVNMLVDITELKSTENELRKSEETLKQLTKDLEKRVEERTAQLIKTNNSLMNANRELEQFAFVASHDMQEPVRKIKTFTSRLAKRSDSVLDEVSKEYLRKISISSERIEHLIHDILHYSRLDHEDSRFVLTDLNEILYNVLCDLELTIEEKKAIIEVSGELPVLKAIPLQITQVFNNIISNSLKFCNTSYTCKIVIASRSISGEEASRWNLDASNSYFEITFADNGIGFNSNYAEAIFNIFKRLNPKDSYDGSGIGLSVCRKIVTAHSGHIFAESEIGKGTVFHVILPGRNPK